MTARTDCRTSARWTPSSESRALSPNAMLRGRHRIPNWTSLARRPNACFPPRALPARGLGRNDASRCWPGPKPTPRRSGPAAMPRPAAAQARVRGTRRAGSRVHGRSCSSRSRDRMLVPMTKVRILGRRSAADAVLGELHRLGLVELADARVAHSLSGLGGAEIRSARSEELAVVLAQTEKLLGEVSDGRPAAGTVQPLRRPLDLPELRKHAREPHPPGRGGRPPPGRAARRALSSFRRILEPLRLLLPLVPVLAASTSRSCVRSDWPPSSSSSTPTTSGSSTPSASSWSKSSAPASSSSRPASRRGRSGVWSCFQRSRRTWCSRSSAARRSAMSRCRSDSKVWH